MNFHRHGSLSAPFSRDLAILSSVLHLIYDTSGHFFLDQSLKLLCEMKAPDDSLRARSERQIN